MSIIIAGGGMTGATLALAISHLTQGQLAVTLVEGTEPASRVHPGFDGRAIALAEGPVSSWRQSASGHCWPPPRRPSPMYMSAIAAMPALSR